MKPDNFDMLTDKQDYNHLDKCRSVLNGLICYWQSPSPLVSISILYLTNFS